MKNRRLAPNEGLIQLPDSRRLGYAEFGDPKGPPVLYFHGTPACRLSHAPFTDAAATVGVRLLCVDRPGIGLSDPQPGRCLVDWADDVARFTTILGLERFGVVGWSGGGPYVVACAARIPERLTGAAILSGVRWLDQPGDRDGLLSLDRLMLTLAQRAPWLGRAVLGSIASLARRIPGRTARSFERDLSPHDIEIWRRLAGPAREKMRFFLAAFDQGAAGVVDDYRVLAEPWGFDPAEIAIPMDIWHGDRDRMVPLKHAQELAASIRQARLMVCPGAGHLLMLERAAEVFAAVTNELAARRLPSQADTIATARGGSWVRMQREGEPAG